MTVFSDWLADRQADRIVLIEMVKADGTIYRFGTKTYVTGPSDSPANAVYEGRLEGGITIDRQLSGPIGFRGGSVADGIIIANPDGVYDDLAGYAWDSLTLWFGDPAWAIADIKSRGQRGTWRIVGMESDDLALRPVVADRYEDLAEPIQAIDEFKGPAFGDPRPLAFGYPKNCPLSVEKATSAWTFCAHEEGDIEDPGVARYINQAPDATAVSKDTYRLLFTLGDPTGKVTADVKGLKGGDPATWLTTPGECLKAALTRTVGKIYGFAGGGSTTTIELSSGDEVSAVDDAYNGDEIARGKPDDDDTSEYESGMTISDYVGSTRVATLSAPTTYATVAGDGYRLHGNTMQTGPLTEADLDTAAFDALDTSLPYEIGLWIDDGRSAEDMLNTVLAPGGYHYFTSAGLLTVGLLTDPSGETAALALTDDDLQDAPDAVNQVASIPPAWSIKVGYDRNHAPERSSAALGALSALRLQWVTKEYRYVRGDDASIRAADREAFKAEIRTVYTSATSAKTELARLSPLFNTRRGVHTIKALADPIAHELGTVFSVTTARHGYAGGTNLVLFRAVETLPDGLTELEAWG